MTIISDDEVMMVDVGTCDTLLALYSTALILLNDKSLDIQLGLEFLKTAKCTTESAEETERQLEEIKKMLSLYKPSEAIYDYRNLKMEAPWKNNISSDVTSCADLYTTADGKDLLQELIALLEYAHTHGVAVEALG